MSQPLPKRVLAFCGPIVVCNVAGAFDIDDQQRWTESTAPAGMTNSCDEDVHVTSSAIDTQKQRADSWRTSQQRASDAAGRTNGPPRVLSDGRQVSVNSLLNNSL